VSDLEMTRRRLLAGAVTGGGLGLLIGSGTAAMLADRETFGANLFAAGALDLEVTVDVAGGGGGHSEGVATIPLELDDETTSGSATLTVTLPDPPAENNPAYAWLRTACPEDSALADALSVTVRYDCDGTEELASGSLIDVANRLRNGVPLSPECDADATAGDQGCLQPEQPLRLVIEWELADDYAGEETLSLPVAVAGRQCRHRDGTTDPFTPPLVEECVDHHGISFVEIYRCGSDGEPVVVGKLELEDYCDQDAIGENSLEPGRYDLCKDGGDCVDTGFDVRVTDTVSKVAGDGTETTGIAFELFEDGTEDGPDLCRVDIAGGSNPGSQGPAEVVYDDASDFDGNATDGVLYAPEKEVDA